MQGMKRPSAPLRKYTPIMLVLPALLILLVLNIFPFIFSLYASFTSLDLKTFGSEGMPFVGLENYVNILGDPVFQYSLMVTLEFTVLVVIVELSVGLFLALLLDQDLKGIGPARALLMIPMAISPVAVGLIFKIELQQEVGIFAYILSQYFNIIFLPLSDAYQALGMLVFVDSWMWSPFVALVLLAGLRSVPQEQVEAANLDGASSVQVFRFVTVPAIRFQIIVVLLLRTMDAFKIFDIVFLMTGGAPGNSTATTSYLIYRVSTQYLQVGRGSAMTYIMLVIIILISNLYIRGILERSK